MNAPLPGSWIKPEKSQPKNSKTSKPAKNSKKPSKDSKPSPKKPFVRKPHLTNKPLMSHEGLAKLKESLPMNKSQVKKPRKRK